MSRETESYIRLVHGYYSKPGYFLTDVDRGTIRTSVGTRICALTDDFLMGFRTALTFECGKANERVFKRCGIRWGQSFVERFDRELTEFYGVPVRDMSTGIIERSLDEAFRYHGWGSLKLDLSLFDQGYIVLSVTDSVYPDVIGRNDKMNDAIMAGFLASILSYYSDTEIDCIQTECTSRGGSASRFVAGLTKRLAPIQSWVQDKLSHDAIVARLKHQPTAKE